MKLIFEDRLLTEISWIGNTDVWIPNGFTGLDSIAVSIFVVILVDCDKCWDEHACLHWSGSTLWYISLSSYSRWSTKIPNEQQQRSSSWAINYIGQTHLCGHDIDEIVPRYGLLLPTHRLDSVCKITMIDDAVSLDWGFLITALHIHCISIHIV